MTFPKLNFVPTKNPKLSAALKSTHNWIKMFNCIYNLIIQFLKLFFGNFPLFKKCVSPKPPQIVPTTNPRVKNNNFFADRCISYMFLNCWPNKPPKMPPYLVLHLKPQENAPCPLLDQHFTFSLKIKTRKCRKTYQADQIVQTDHLTGHPTFTFIGPTTFNILLWDSFHIYRCHGLSLPLNRVCK